MLFRILCSQGVIWESFESPLRVLWESSGSPLGPFGSPLYLDVVMMTPLWSPYVFEVVMWSPLWSPYVFDVVMWSPLWSPFVFYDPPWSPCGVPYVVTESSGSPLGVLLESFFRFGDSADLLWSPLFWFACIWMSAGVLIKYLLQAHGTMESLPSPTPSSLPPWSSQSSPNGNCLIAISTLSL